MDRGEPVVRRGPMKAWTAGIALALVLGSAGTGRAQAQPQGEDVTKHPGYVDFGLVNLFGKQQADVEVILESNLIEMLQAFTPDPELKAMLSKLKQIRAECYAIEPDKLEAIEKKTAEMSAKLMSLGWS